MATKSQFPGKNAPSYPHANEKNLPMPIRKAKMRKIQEKKRKAEKHAIMLAVANATMTQTTRPISKTSSQPNQRMTVHPRTNHLLPKTTSKERIKVARRALEEEVQKEKEAETEAEAETETEAETEAAAAEVAEEAEGDLGDTMMTSICSRASVPEIN